MGRWQRQASAHSGILTEITEILFVLYRPPNSKDCKQNFNPYIKDYFSNCNISPMQCTLSISVPASSNYYWPKLLDAERVDTNKEMHDQATTMLKYLWFVSRSYNGDQMKLSLTVNLQSCTVGKWHPIIEKAPPFVLINFKILIKSDTSWSNKILVFPKRYSG